ncbi:MAG: AI-2E family transporter [Caulobacteraceae bacterium]|nr:AI-2E family transporter [Caulobacteraceae bacterium]
MLNKPPDPSEHAAQLPAEAHAGHEHHYSVALRNAGVFLAVIAGGVTVRYLREIITPLMIAVFLLLLIDGVARAADKRLPFVPAWLRSAAGAVFIIAGFAVVVGVCVHYARGFGGQFAALEPKIDNLLMNLCASLELPPLTLSDLFRSGNASARVGEVLGVARGVLVEAILVVVYLGFLLASRQAFGRKARKIFASRGGQQARRVFNRVRSASEQYIGLQTFKAALVAVAAWAIMSMVGLDNALFLAFVIFLASFVPIVGGIAGSAVPALLALAQFDTLARPIILLVAVSGTLFVIENIILPKLQSDRLNLDPVFILVSLAFWGAMLGIPGALMSTPLTVMVMAVASEFEGARWLAMLLSKEGELTTRAEDEAD